MRSASAERMDQPPRDYRMGREDLTEGPTPNGPVLLRVVTVVEQAAFLVADAARYLGISANTLRKKSDLGLIPAKRDEAGNRIFLLVDLDAYLKSLPPFHKSGKSLGYQPVKTGRWKGGTR